MTSANEPHRPTFFERLRGLALGFLSGLCAGLLMLACMAFLRLFLYVATPTEMIFDRAFPLVTVDFFIGALGKAGSYSSLKLEGVWGALAGQLIAAGLGGIVYAWFVGRRPANPGWTDRRGWWLVGPGVLTVWMLFVALLWPQLATNYHGRPAAAASVVTCLGMLLSFAVCGVALMFFHGLLTKGTAPAVNADDQAADAGLTRRRFLAGGVAVLATIALGGMLRRFFRIGTFGYDGTQYLGPDIAKITPTDKFYQVTKNLVDPDVARQIWRLDLSGNVETPRVWSFDALTALSAVTQETTLQCISYGVGSGLISNAVWKGVSLPVLLAEVRPKSDTVAVLFHAADGYYETFPFSKALEPTTLVAWEMNGAPLPPHHGFPIRMIVPGIYGERSAKWVTRLEFLAKDDPRLKINRHGIKGVGFYTEQGWGPDIFVPTTSRIDGPKVAGDHFDAPFKVGQPVALHGMAFGGDKGIGNVELSFDDGHTWTDAPITAPGTRISWSLWTYQWTPETPGDCVLLVRATNADGQAQITENRGPVPDGATGLHRVKGRIDPA